MEGVAGDATDPGAVERAVEGADVLYYLVHSMSAGKGFEDADRRAAETVAKAAAAASVARIVYLGGCTPTASRCRRTCDRESRWARCS